MKAGEYYGIGFKKGTYGIEIEVEGDHLVPVNNQFWKATVDHSLRGEAYEYVLKKPIEYGEVEEAMTTLGKGLAESTIKFSYRCSTHVHINILNWERVNICNFIYLWMLFEEPLVRYCGQERVGNRFCLRVRDAEGMVDAVTHGFVRREFPVFDKNLMKYAALNLSVMHEYGSIEVRTFRGSINKAEVFEWVSILEKMRKFALKDMPFKMMKDMCPMDLFNMVFEEYAETLSYKGMEFDIRMSGSRCIEFPNEVPLTTMQKAVQGEKKAMKILRQPHLDFHIRPVPDPFQAVFNN